MEDRVTVSMRWVAGLVLSPILVLIAATGGCEARKAYYDWRVRKLCAKDGGARISERMRISPDQAGHLPSVDGRLGIAPELLADPASPVFGRLRQQTIREGQPTLTRYEEEIVRRADGRTIAYVVSYTRAGGDFPTFAHPSLYSCPTPATLRAELEGIFEFEEIRR